MCVGRILLMCLNVCMCCCSFLIVFVTFWSNLRLFWMSVPSSLVVGSCLSVVLLKDSLMSGCVCG